LTDLFGEWMLSHVQRECTPRTAEAYQEQGAYVLRKIGGMLLQNIRRNLMEDTIREIADHGGVPTTEHPAGRPLGRKLVRNIGFVLRGCFSYAVHRAYIATNPMDGMKLPKLEKNRKPKIVEADDFERVLRLASGTRLFPLIVLAEEPAAAGANYARCSGRISTLPPAS
jgi:site-specific recombinase XerC